MGRGTIYSSYQIVSIQDRADQAELKINAAETIVSDRSEKVLQASANFDRSIYMRLDEITVDAQQQMDRAVKTVENNVALGQKRINEAVKVVEYSVEPAKQRIVSHVKTVEDDVVPGQKRINEAVKVIEYSVEPAKQHSDKAVNAIENNYKQSTLTISKAVDEVMSQRKNAFKKLDVPSIDKLGVVKRQIEEIEKAVGKLNLKSIRSFINLEILLLLIFSVIALLVSVAAWIRVGRKCKEVSTKDMSKKAK